MGAFHYGASSIPQLAIIGALNAVTSFSAWLFHRSILSYSNERILAERMKRASLPLGQKMLQAAGRSALEVPKRLITAAIFKKALNLAETLSPSLALPKTDNTTRFEDIPPIDVVIISPIGEELRYRALTLESLLVGQTFLKDWTEGSSIDWLTTDYARVILAQLIFASIHLQAGYQSTYGALVQSLGILFGGSAYAIEYETSVSLMASLSSHVTNNAIVLAMHTLLNGGSRQP